MHINNVSAKTSRKTIIIFLVFSIVYSVIAISMYIFFSSDAQKTFSGFFKWFFLPVIKLLNNEPVDSYITDLINFFILPVIFYTGLVWSILSRYFALTKLSSSLNLKSVDLLADRINFNFNNNSYNFTCGNRDINKLELVLHTKLRRTKYGNYIVLDEIRLNFTVLGNRTFSLSNTPVIPMKVIYQIIDYSRKIEKFSYKFDGAGEDNDIKERIDEYIHKGIKPMLTSVSEYNLKWASVISFVLGLFLCIQRKEIINFYYLKHCFDFGILIFGILILISFIFDIILIINKIKEKSSVVIMDINKLNKLLEELKNLSENSSAEEKQKILEMINSALRSEPKSIHLLNCKALYYQIVNDYDNAMSVYKEIEKINPEDTTQENIDSDSEYINLQNRKEELLCKYDYQKIENTYVRKKISVSFIVTAKLIILAVVVYFCFLAMIFSYNDNNILNIKDTSGFQTIKVNPMSEYDYMSKQQIYNLRKNYVKNSVFSKTNYEPENSVFGSITDNKPWWGDTRCGILNYKGDYKERTKGPSKVSAQMNNPTALVGLSMPILPWANEYNKEFCSGEYGKFLPVSLQYSKKNHLIIAKYNLTGDFLKFRTRINGRTSAYPVQLSGLNAKDFGYNYVYAYNMKNIKMYSSNNVSDDVKEFADYIHLGGSCKYKDGCNNISPMQYDKMFIVTNLPAEINLKLWKKEPFNKNLKADMYYRIIFNQK